MPAPIVSKAEVRNWPFFGMLAKLQRSVFIDRRPQQVANHADEEKAIPFGTSRLVELRHLLRAEHPGHEHVVLHAVHLHPVSRRVGRRHGLAPIAQPVAHEFNLVPLTHADALAERQDVGARVDVLLIVGTARRREVAAAQGRHGVCGIDGE